MSEQLTLSRGERRGENVVAHLGVRETTPTFIFWRDFLCFLQVHLETTEFRVKLLETPVHLLIHPRISTAGTTLQQVIN